MAENQGGQPQSAKVTCEVVAGLIPNQPEPEYTKRFALTSKQWEDAETVNVNQMELLAELNGKAQGYAMLLMLQPDRLNWVRTDWIWL